MWSGGRGVALVAAMAVLAGCSTQAPKAPKPTPRPLVNLTCGALEIGVHPTVAGISTGRIVPGRGVANIEVGMTRDQVIARVGPPVCEVGSPGSIAEDIWDFAPVSPDPPHTATRLLVFFDRGPDRDPKAKIMNIVAAGGGFQLEDGSPAFGPGTYVHFARLYAGRITSSSSGDVWTYRVSPDAGDTSGVITQFNGREPGPNALDQGTVGVQATGLPAN